MRYKKKTHTVEAFRVRGCEVTIHEKEGGNLTAIEGDWILVFPDGRLAPMPAEDFVKMYEVE